MDILYALGLPPLQFLLQFLQFTPSCRTLKKILNQFVLNFYNLMIPFPLNFTYNLKLLLPFLQNIQPDSYWPFMSSETP